LFALVGIEASLAADAYPTRPLHLIVGFPAGGPTDIVARLVAQSLSVRLGPQVVVENRPGAGSNVATQVVVSAAPLSELGSAPLIVTPQAFGAFLAAETEKWAKAVRFSGASID